MLNIFYAVVIFAAPYITSLEMEDPSKIALKVGYSDSEFANQCLQGGLELRYRYSLQLCKRRSYWLDSCLTSQRQIQKAHFDPISEKFIVALDRHGDRDAPRVTSSTTMEEAVSQLSLLKDFPLLFLADEDQGYLSSQRKYVSARVEVTCKGEYNKTLARISYILSLGLVNLRGFDSGWQDVFLPGGYLKRDS